MACGLVLTASDNGDFTVSVQVTGTPSGTLSLLSCSTPDVGKAQPCAYWGSLPSLTAFIGNKDLIYLWAKDQTGISASPVAVWSGKTGSYVQEIGTTLQSIILSNKPGIEAAMHDGGYPGTTLKDVVWGSQNISEASPSVVIMPGRWSWTYAAIPYVRLFDFRFTISCVILHNREQTEIPMATQLTYSVSEILSKVEYNEITLPSGLQIYNTYSDSGDTEEFVMGESRWAAIGNLNWSGQALVQRTR